MPYGFARVVSAETAVAELGDGATVALSGYVAEPVELVDALFERAPGRRLTLHHALVGSRERLSAPPPGVRVITNAPTRRSLAAQRAGAVAYLPASIYRLHRWLLEGKIRLDAAIVQVSPPDAEGMCSFGVAN